MSDGPCAFRLATGDRARTVKLLPHSAFRFVVCNVIYIYNKLANKISSKIAMYLTRTHYFTLVGCSAIRPACHFARSLEPYP